MDSPVSKRNIHTKQRQPFPQSLIFQHGVLKLLFISHDKTDKENQCQDKRNKTYNAENDIVLLEC